MSIGAPPPKPLRTEDGRHLRSAESRRRILKAMHDLVQEGDTDPAAEAVDLLSRLFKPRL